MAAVLPTISQLHAASTAAKYRLPLDKALGSVERAVDFLVVMGTLALAYRTYLALNIGKRAYYTASELLLAGAAYALLFVLLLERHGEYRPYVSLLWVRETERLLRVTLQSALFAMFVGYFLAVPVSRLVFLFAISMTPVMLTLEKCVTHKAIRVLRSKGYGTRKTVIFGTGSTGRQIYSVLARSPKFGLDPIGFVDDDPQQWNREIYECSYHRKSPARVLPGAVSPELLKKLGASVLVIALQDLSQDEVLQWVARFSAEGMTVYFAPAESFESGVHIEYSEIDGIVLAHSSGENARTVYETGKRLLDLAVSALLVVLLWPLLAAIALLIRTTSPGPVIFRQKRVGKNGDAFSMLKFRTMFTNAPDYAFSPTADEDPRITPVGRLLRRTSLDELPQIVNVLLGHMSLVGPRPEMPFIADQYSPMLRERLKVKPGMTGLWQLSADRAFLIHENIEYDLYYLFNNPRFVWNACLQLAHLRSFELKS